MKRRDLFIGILFGVLGFAGNWLKFELFLNIDILFGSIFSMFALLRFGPIPSMIAAVIASSCTLLLWNHPWAIIIISAEAATVGWWYHKRDNSNILLVDMLYWVCLGAPMIWFFYHGIMGVQQQATYLIMLKQGVNGISNSLIASVAYLIIQFNSQDESKKPNFRNIAFIVMVTLVTIPTTGYLALNLHKELFLGKEELKLHTNLVAEAAKENILTWITSHHEHVITMAQQIGDPSRKSTQSMQPVVEALVKSSSSFNRGGVLNDRAITVAYYPLTDAAGKPHLGVDFSDRPFIPILKQTKRPYVPDLVMARFGKPVPMLPLLAPIIINNDYRGYCTGILDLSRLKDMLAKQAGNSGVELTILDRNRRIIASTRSNLKLMERYELPKGGSMRPMADGVIHWIPELERGVSVMQRWRKSLLIKEQQVSPDITWIVVSETSLLPLLQHLTEESIIGFLILCTLMLGVMGLACILSKHLSNKLHRLEAATSALPQRLLLGHDVTPPRFHIRELQALSSNFELVTEALKGAFVSLRQANENLEEKIEERTAELRQSKENWERTFDAMHDPILIVDRDYRILNINKAALNKLGITKEEALEQTCVFCIHGNESPPDNCLQKMTLQDMQVHTIELEGTRLGKHCLVTTTPVFDENGEYAASIHISHDITELKEHETELDNARKEADAANRAKSVFLANMSHEIRTPMNGIVGMVELLKLTDITDEQQEYLQNITLSADNLLSIINDILDLSKIEAGKIELEYADFSLKRCISSTLGMVTSRILEKGLNYQVKLADQLPLLVNGDQLRVKQILLNLLSNAVKFTEQGCITVTADIKERYDHTVLIDIAVSDTGIGMPENVLEKIFTPFVQAEISTTRKYGGTGLGLTICRQLSELMGGGISVESSEGTGSTFHLTIPFDISSTRTIDMAEVSTEEDIAEGPSLRILLAEDNEINEKFSRSLLTKMGHTVMVASNGMKAIELWEQNTFDLILMDIHMPELGGDEATAIIRQKEQEIGQHIPIIAVTAYALKGDKERFLQHGFDGYLAKPFRKESLKEELDKVCA